MILGPHYVIDFDNFVIRVHESLSMVILAMGWLVALAMELVHAVNALVPSACPTAGEFYVGCTAMV